MDILIDFDGTCVTHKFPGIGKDIGAVPVLKKLVKAGHRLILFTMRSNLLTYTSLEGTGLVPNRKGNFLNQAIKWFLYNDIPLYGVQTNPTQSTWTESPKAYGQLMIDDSALGCPLIYPENGDRPYVDWERVENILANELKII